jgi:hypothetical protein
VGVQKGNETISSFFSEGRYFVLMVKQNYFDFDPTTGIANQLKAENIEDESAIQMLIVDINRFIDTVEQENVKYLIARKNLQVAPDHTVKLFRNQKRIQNVCWILQFLVAFLSKLPLKDEIKGQPVNPFEQFKTFIRFRVDLIKTPDVSRSILMRYERLGILNESNAWYYRGKISKNYKQIIKLVDSARTATIENYCKLFEALHRLCLFWFSVKSEDIKRVRKSDIYIYKLTRILLNRCRTPDS